MTTSTAPIVPVAGLDPEWFTTALRDAGELPAGSVVAVERSPCGTGQLADSYRFALTYDAHGAGPASVVVKVTSDDATSREFGRETGWYTSEIRFYEEVATELPISVPRAIHAAIDDGGADFVLMMEDLAPARTVDQLVGCTIDEAALVVEQAAALHAGSWNDARLAQRPWLQSTAAAFVGATASFPDILGTFREMFDDLVPEDQLDEAARLNDLVPEWQRVIQQPRSLWHSDFRVDNILFDAHGGAVPVCILDWQTVGMGVGTIDLAYFLGGSITTEDRRANERDLVRHYHQCLLSHGVERYSEEQCWDDYRMLSIYGLQVGIFGAVRVKRTERGDEMWRMFVDRHTTQTRDLGSFDALRGS